MWCGRAGSNGCSEIRPSSAQDASGAFHARTFASKVLRFSAAFLGDFVKFVSPYKSALSHEAYLAFLAAFNLFALECCCSFIGS